MEDYFQKELNIPVFMTIKNILLARRHSLLATVTERSWRSRIQTHEKSVYRFQMAFQMVASGYWRKTGAIPVKTNSFLVMRM
jgi:hypothetical protein